MDRYVGSPPFQWQGEINQTSQQAHGLIALFHPLMHWRDLIGGYQMTPVGDAIANGVDAQLGRTYSLDGTGDCAYVTLPESWKLQKFTVSAWINCTTLGAGAQVWFALSPRGAAADARGIYCYVTNAYVSTAIGAGSGSYTQAFLNATRYANTLYHVAGSYDGTTLRTWQNGVLVASTSITMTIVYADKAGSYGPNPASAYIGNYHDSDNTAPDVAVDLIYDTAANIGPVSLWNRALSAAEMWALYDPATRWELYVPPKPMFWWIPPITGGILPLAMHHRRQQGIS